jgi:hypothetical protein
MVAGASDGAARTLPPPDDQERVLAQLEVPTHLAEPPVEERGTVGAVGSGYRTPVELVPDRHVDRLARARGDRVTRPGELFVTCG